MTRRSFGHIRKLPSKRFQASFVNGLGVRETAPYTFLTRSDASAWLSMRESEYRRPNPLIPADEAIKSQNSPIFEDYVKRHISIQTNADGHLLRESTQNLYRRLLRVNLADFHGRELSNVTPAEVSQWWANAVGKGKKTSASKAYKLLSSVMKRAVDEQVISSNPCKVRGAHSANSGKQVYTPTKAEVWKISEAINPRYQKMVVLMAFGGFRFGEVTELRRRDVRFQEISGQGCYTFQVERAVTLVRTEDGKPLHKVDKPKSKSSVRSVTVSSSLTYLIERLLDEIPQNPESLLFPGTRNPNSHLRHDVFMNSWRRALKRAGIATPYSPHSLRHFAGSHFHLAGANIPELKQWLGDGSTAAVMRYIHPTGRTDALAMGMDVEENVSEGDCHKPRRR